MGPRRFAIALIALVALVFHGAMLLETVRVSDDWSFLAWLTRKEWTTLHGVHVYSNALLLEYYARAYAYFPDILLAARAAAFLFVLAGGLLAYLLCAETGYLENAESIFVALIAMVYPGYLMYTSLTLGAFTFCLMLFLAAALVALRSERRSGAAHAGMRLAALLLFFLSFSMNSLLVFFGAFLLLHFLVLRREWSLPWAAAAWRYAQRRADYLAIPLVFWSTKWITKAVYETNPDYNAITLGASNLAGFADFARSFGAQWLMILKSPWFVPVLVVASAATWWLCRRRPAARRTDLRNWALLAFGLLLLICATLPYVVVGKSPTGDLDQWGTRLCLLMGLPAGVLAVALGGLLAQHARLPRAIATGLLSAIVAGGGAVQAKHHIRFLANEIEARSLAVNLARNPDAARFSVFGVVTPLPSFHITHQKYSWAYFLRDALGGELNRIAIMEDNIDAAASTRKRYTAMQLREETDDWWFRLYGMKLPPDGRQATLVIEPGPGRVGIADHRLVSRYLRAKWAGAERLESFLRSVTAVKVIPKA
jgi:hypothetical protein